MRRLLFLLTAGLVIAAVSFGAIACGDGDENGDGGEDTPAVTEPANGEATEPMDEEATEPADGEGAAVGVTLVEWDVVPEPTSAIAGDVTFNATNIGAETHEVIVIRTELDPAELPTNEDGSVNEEGEGIEVIGRTEELGGGSEESITLTLEAGAYALVCNIVDEADGDVTAHYAEGMFTSFTVE